MTNEIFDPDSSVDAGDAGDWQPVERAPKRRKPGAVLSVRISSDTAQRLEAFAQRRGVSVSEAARDALAAVVQDAQVVPYGIRVADHEVSAKFATHSVTITQRGSLSVGMRASNQPGVPIPC